ncbi:GNAT family N-acetyltransferase [Ornithinibacillus bavariensis]|uniref:GNAT family N-acetyltransferase n=1 Tax=Ornithinibacillus bavariensis TaxID=545502 RepID=UPI000EE5ED9F|nr:GNAT family N-acetyltransferase [Ornithinibacillus sp.]
MTNLYFRKFHSDDFDHYFSLVSNESVMAMITERAIPLEEAHTNYKKILELNKKHELFGTYKVSTTDNVFLGLGRLILNEENTVEAELGYMLLPEFWGNSYGSKIADYFIEQARNTALTRLTAIIDPNNIPSRKILTNRGFISEKLCEIDGLPGEILSKALSDSITDKVNGNR